MLQFPNQSQTAESNTNLELRKTIELQINFPHFAVGDVQNKMLLIRIEYFISILSCLCHLDIHLWHFDEDKKDKSTSVP
jgi:hypothetical protein